MTQAKDDVLEFERPAPVSLGEGVTQRIRLAILRGELSEGKLLVERELAKQFDVSKTPVREALKVLSRSGLVDVTPYRKVVVRRVDAEMIANVSGVRLLLEPEAVRAATHRHTTSSIAALQHTLEEATELARRGDIAALGMANRQFHQELYLPCGNPLLVRVLDDLQDQLCLIAVALWRHQRTWPREALEHAAIVGAIARADADAAAGTLRLHIETSLRDALVRLRANGS